MTLDCVFFSVSHYDMRAVQSIKTSAEELLAMEPMLWYGKSLRERVQLRVNDNGKKWSYQHLDGTWIQATDEVLSTMTAALVFDEGGKRLNVHSHFGYAQAILMVDINTGRTVGIVNVTEGGGLLVEDNPTFLVRRPLPVYWRQRATLIVGCKGPFSIGIYDAIGDDFDTLRYKTGETKIFRTAHYLSATVDYDRVPETGPANRAYHPLGRMDRIASHVVYEPSSLSVVYDAEPSTSATVPPPTAMERAGEAAQALFVEPVETEAVTQPQRNENEDVARFVDPAEFQAVSVASDDEETQPNGSFRSSVSRQE